MEIPARGKLKFKAENIKVGDYVEFENGIITRIKPRKSFFNRTNVANISCVNIIIASVPTVDFLLVDKLIVEGNKGGAKVIITVNKSDLSRELYEYCIANYTNAVDKIFSVSTATGDGIEQLKSYLKGEFCALAGQSAVGKTSLINSIFNIEKPVNSVSEKTLRGRHTTTSREIHYGDNFAVIDTPGFSAIDTYFIESGKLAEYYKEFENYNGKCYYIGCSHTVEPDCLVKNAVDDKKISLDRYNRYCTIYKEIKEYEKRKY